MARLRPMRQLFIFLLCVPLALLSQDAEEVKNWKGDVQVEMPETVEAMLKEYIAQNEEENSMPGFRVQIMSSQQKLDVLKVKSDFYKKFPEIRTYLDWVEPNFVLRAGDFHHRLEAEKAMLEISGEFPSAFVVVDKLKLK